MAGVEFCAELVPTAGSLASAGTEGDGPGKFPECAVWS